jgi:hypothetical protein
MKRNISTLPDGSQITFRAWFVNRLATEPRLKEHHYDQIRFFMKGLGIGEVASSKMYERGLCVFFGD